MRGLLYVAGLWVDDLHYGLLWTPARNAPLPLSGCNAPSWSWASTSFPVTWPRREGDCRDSCEVVAILGRDGSEFRFENAPKAQHPSVQKPGNAEANTRQELFGVTNGSLLLKIHEMVIRAKVSSALLPDRAHNLADRYTGSTGPSSIDWRAVYDTHPEREDFIAGWAAICHPQALELLSAPYENAEFCVLQVSSGKARGGIQFGHFGFSHIYFNVLLLCQESDGRYVRVGSGAIFEKGFFRSEICSDIILD